MATRFVWGLACVGLVSCNRDRPDFDRTGNQAQGDASISDGGDATQAESTSFADASVANGDSHSTTAEIDVTGADTAVNPDSHDPRSTSSQSDEATNAMDAGANASSTTRDASPGDTHEPDVTSTYDSTTASTTDIVVTNEDASADSSNSTSEPGPDPECNEEQTRTCWEDEDGNPITDDPADAIGNCRLGEQACTNDGTWGPCVGAVAPEAEDECNSPDDDNNCNGSANDGCDCIANDTRPCGTDVGPCSVGVQSCGSDNKWASECVGGVAAQAKDGCAVADDDANCNAEPNDDCECIGDETEACNDCGVKTCDAATGRWGACSPSPDEAPRCNTNNTGIQSCDADGFWQTAPCTNSDTANCNVSCQDSSGEAVCEYQAKDGDNDGYRSQACAPSPGDDCDDTTQLVSPGATETCDGQDNDCDGYPDAMDATIRFPSVITYVRKTTAATVPNLRRLDITWHDDEFFFLADGNQNASYKSIYSGYARTDGTVVLRDGEVLATNNSDILYDSPRVTSAGGVLGAVVRVDGRSYGSSFITLDSDGSVLTSTGASTSYSGGDITSNGSAFVMATFSRPFVGTALPYTFNFSTGTTGGDAASAATQRDLTAGASALNIAYAGSTAAVAYTDPTAANPSVQLMRLVAGTIQGPTQLATSAQYADITTTADGKFAIAWATAAGFRLQIRETNGTTVICDTQDVAFGNGTLNTFDSVAVAQSSLGIVVFAADNGVKSGATGGEAAVFVFDSSCQQLTEQGKKLTTNVLNSPNELPHLPRIAVGGGAIALAWSVQQSDNLEDYHSYIQVLPEDMCQ